MKRSRLTLSGLVLGVAVSALIGACSKPEVDNELGDVTPAPRRRPDPSGSGGGGGLPKPAPSSSSSGGSGGKPLPDGGSADPDGGRPSSGSVSCEDDFADEASSIPDDDYYYIPATDADGRLEIKGVLSDYWDYDIFGIDVDRHVSPTLWVPNPPPEIQLCAYLLCTVGEPQGLTCDTGTEDEHEGMRGCCGDETVSMGYTRCSGSSEWVTLYTRVTSYDYEGQCVDYTIRTSL